MFHLRNDEFTSKVTITKYLNKTLTFLSKQIQNLRILNIFTQTRLVMTSSMTPMGVLLTTARVDPWWDHSLEEDIDTKINLQTCFLFALTSELSVLLSILFQCENPKSQQQWWAAAVSSWNLQLLFNGICWIIDLYFDHQPIFRFECQSHRNGEQVHSLSNLIINGIL